LNINIKNLSAVKKTLSPVCEPQTVAGFVMLAREWSVILLRYSEIIYKYKKGKCNPEKSLFKMRNPENVGKRSMSHQNV